jgi:hypothetical protein
MNAQRNRGMYLRVNERLAEILLDLQLTEADRRPFKLPAQLVQLPIEPAEERLCGLRRSRPCADARHRQTVNEWPVPTGHRVQRPVQRACNGSNKFVSNCERPDA